MARTGTATVMFTDIVDSTGVRARRGDDAADAMRRTHDAVLHEAAADHGGTVVKGLGDGAMTTFESASQAVAAAVQVQQAVDAHNRRAVGERLEVRIGLSAGDVLWEADDCFGSPVIEAARVCAAAAGGEILTTDVVRLLARSIEGSSFSSRGELVLKGLDRPVPTHELRWEPLAALPAVSGQPPLPDLLRPAGQLSFNGRDAHVAEALDIWTAALAGERQALLLSGEPGIGKTRLAGEVAGRAHAGGATVLYGRCEENLGAPYQPFAEALDYLLGAVPAEVLLEQLGRYPGELVRMAPSLSDRLPDLPAPLVSDAETERYRLFEAVASWLGAAAAERGLVVVLDDLHWASRPTLMLLQHVLNVTAGRVLLIGTYRDTDLGRTDPLSGLLADLRRSPGVTRMPLTGLDLDGVVRLVADAAGHELDDAGRSLAAAIHAETEGNPFFVGEVLRHLRETRAIYQQDGRWVSDLSVGQMGIPEGIREVVGRRLDRLSTDANDVLPVAAVVGRDFGLALVSAAADKPEDVVVAGLEEAVAARLVEETGVGCYRFAHALVRTTLYEELSATRRARLHAQVAAQLERLAPDDVVGLAHQYAAATVAGDLDKAARYSTLAGDLAMAQLAHDAAASYYAQALELLTESGGADEHRCETLLALGEAQRRSGDAAYRATLLEAAALASDLDDASRLTRAAVGNSRGFWSMAGDVDHERIAVLQEALRRLEGGDAGMRARVLGRLAGELMFTSDRAHREQLCADAVAAARATGDPLILADVLSEAGPTSYTPWAIEQGARYVSELVELADRLDDPYRRAVAHLWRYITSFFLGEDPAVGEEALRAAEALTTDLGQPTLQWLTGVWRTVQTQQRGEMDAALELAAKALAAGQRAEQPDAWTWYAGQLSSIYRETGRGRDLVEKIEMEIASSPGLPAWDVVLALCLWDAGREDEARAVMRRLVDVDHRELRHPEDIMWLFAVAMLLDVAAYVGDTAAAEVLYEQLLPFRHLSVHGGVAFAGAAELHLGIGATALRRLDLAVDHLEAAVTTHERLQARLYLGMSHAELARALLLRRAPGDEERAAAAIRTARTLADETNGGLIRKRLPEVG